MAGPPNTRFKPTRKNYEDRIASERITTADVQEFNPQLAALLRELDAENVEEGDDET